MGLEDNVIDFNKPVFINPADGSYIVTTANPAYPYNVLPDDPMWQSIQDWLAEGNKADPYVPPEPVALDPAIAAQIQLAALMPDVIDALIAQAQGTAGKGVVPKDDPIAAWQALRAQVKG
jgi:hypothetical protein